MVIRKTRKTMINSEIPFDKIFIFHQGDKWYKEVKV